MAMTLTPVDPVDGEAVLPLALAKAQLRVESDDDDDLIAVLRDAAVEWVERYCSIALAERAWVVGFDGFATSLRLPMGPVNDVSALTYLNTAGAETELAESGWRRNGALLFAAAGTLWPTALAGGATVEIAFIAGHDADTRPRPLVTAAMLLLGHLYANREAAVTGVSVTEVPFGVTALCAPYRTPVIG